MKWELENVSVNVRVALYSFTLPRTLSVAPSIPALMCVWLSSVSEGLTGLLCGLRKEYVLDGMGLAKGRMIGEITSGRGTGV